MTDFDPAQYRVLVVDDSDVLLEAVDATLSRAGFQVSTAISGEEAQALIKKRGLPHLAIVDINMPFGMDGFEFCEWVHEFSDLPIIMLTAVDEGDTIIDAIEQFAEDYITKPFGTGELVARVRRVLRRIGDFAYELDVPIQVDERLSVDFAAYQARLEGRSVTLSPTETKLLYILMRSSGRTVATDFLLRRLWPNEVVYEDRLRVYIHRLRQKIETTPTQPRYIISHRGTGYAFLGGTDASLGEVA